MLPLSANRQVKTVVVASLKIGEGTSKMRPLFIECYLVIFIMAAEGKAIIFYRCNFFYFVSMKDQPWDLNQTWLVGRNFGSGVNLQMSPKISGGLSPKSGAQKHLILDHFFGDFFTRHRISPERNVALTNKNASVNLQCVP